MEPFIKSFCYYFIPDSLYREMYAFWGSLLALTLIVTLKTIFWVKNVNDESKRHFWTVFFSNSYFIYKKQIHFIIEFFLQLLRTSTH